MEANVKFAKEICLVLFCGIPASGKTTFISKLNNAVKSDIGLKKNWESEFVIICFDKIMPIGVETQLIAMNFLLPYTIDGFRTIQSMSEWKAYRRNILKCIESLIKLLTGKTSEWDPAINKTVLKNFLKVVPCDRILTTPTKKVICVDDNLYYSSMRYEYFQLARKYEIGFCQFYMTCAVETAINRNQNRPNKVLNDIIYTMFDKFEPPSDKKLWEKNSLNIDSESNDDVLTPALELILFAFNDPIPPLPVEDLESQTQSRTITLANIIHQSDQALRKLVKESILEHKDSESSDNLKHCSKIINSCRTKILEDLQQNKIIIPDNITDNESLFFTLLYDFLKPVFNHHLTLLKGDSKS